MELPNNFDQFKPTIEFWRAQGVNCLTSNNEKIFLIYVYGDHYRVVGDYNDETIVLENMIKDGYLVRYNRQLYEEELMKLSKISSNAIIRYLNCKCKILTMKPTSETNITILNSFNTSKI